MGFNFADTPNRAFLRSARALLRQILQDYPVGVVTGARQTGKSTLLRNELQEYSFVSLEDIDLREFAIRDPRGFLQRFQAPLVIDEAQHVPQLLSYIQTIVDQKLLDGSGMGHYVLSGSQQFGLLAGVTQSLAGRAGLVELHPLCAKELAGVKRLPTELDQLLWLGGYPAIHARGLDPVRYHGNYVANYIERDVRSLAAVQDLGNFQRFMRLCAARTGQLLNLNGLANDCGISQPTAAAWMNVLEASYVVKRVPPYFSNFGKRLVKAPKLYFLDTGLACWLLGIHSVEALQTHYARGALFETWVVNEALRSKAARGDARPVYYWRDNIGNEVDLVLEDGNGFTLVEVKSGATFQSEWLGGLRTVARHIGTQHKVRQALVYGGQLSMQREGVEVIAWADLALSP